MRNLILVLGDQLDPDASAFDGFDPAQDAVWMAEVHEEATHVWSHKQRLVLFFSAMRHFRDELRDRSIDVHYHALSADPAEDHGESHTAILTESITTFAPTTLIVTKPGDWRVEQNLARAADNAGVPLEVREDRHFYCDLARFQEFAEGRKQLRLETFYRQLRREFGVLMLGDDPVGGEWNYDQDNRKAFPKDGPGELTAPRGFEPDACTREVISLVEARFGDHPGETTDFDLPVTREQAREMLHAFIEHGLPRFGKYEDAMWSDEPFLYHSRLSAPLNLKLLDPRWCVDLAVQAHEAGAAPLNSVEGFVRQILGWREFIRGVYWLRMPEYAELNALNHDERVPTSYWDGDTDMECVRQSMQHVLRYGYSHHIHRLMVLGNFALLLGVHPRRFHDWHMAMYLDAVDWVSLPNTLGMSQYGDGGVVGTKPYVSTGNYIHKMSPFCRDCRFAYKKNVGDDACPITTLYWDFLDTHHDTLRSNHRMGFQLKNVRRKRDKGEMPGIREQAAAVRRRYLPTC